MFAVAVRSDLLHRVGLWLVMRGRAASPSVVRAQDGVKKKIKIKQANPKQGRMETSGRRATGEEVFI